CRARRSTRRWSRQPLRRGGASCRGRGGASGVPATTSDRWTCGIGTGRERDPPRGGPPPTGRAAGGPPPHPGSAGGTRAPRAASRIGAGVVSPTAPEFYTPGAIFMACGRGGYLGQVRLEDGRLDLAAAFEPEALRQAGGPGPAAAHLLDEAGWPAVPGVATLP